MYTAHASVGSAAIKKLIKKFGKKFVANKLPKKIFKKFPKIVKKKIGYKSFHKFWKSVVITGAGASVQKVVYKWLVKHHCPKFAASAASWAIGAVIWWYIS